MKVRAAILIVSILLFVFLAAHPHRRAPLSKNDLGPAVVAEVKGDVSMPGIYLLDGAGATVAAASNMAGSPWKISESFARLKLTAGQSLKVLHREDGITIEFGRMPAAALLACGLKLDVNSASLDELLLIPHMRHEIAVSIVERGKRKAWEEIDQLGEIVGVGPKTVQTLKNYLCVMKTANENGATE